MTDTFDYTQPNKIVNGVPILLTADEISKINAANAEWQNGQAQRAQTILVSQAKVALQESDTTIIRCYSAGVNVPSDIQAYRVALRAIATGKDTTSAVLPTKPNDYPAGT